MRIKSIVSVFFSLLFLVGCTSMSVSPSIKSVNLLKNGGFETPQMNKGTWRVFPAIKGWSLSYGPGIEIQNHVAGSPNEGAQFVELSSHDNSGIYQDIVTVPNNRYILSFAFSARPRTGRVDNSLEILWDARRVDKLSSDGLVVNHSSWKMYTYEVTASSFVTRLEFKDLSKSSSLGTYLDAVSLISIEPWPQ